MNNNSYNNSSHNNDNYTYNNPYRANNKNNSDYYNVNNNYSSNENANNVDPSFSQSYDNNQMVNKSMSYAPNLDGDTIDNNFSYDDSNYQQPVYDDNSAYQGNATYQDEYMDDGMYTEEIYSDDTYQEYGSEYDDTQYAQEEYLDDGNNTVEGELEEDDMSFKFDKKSKQYKKVKIIFILETVVTLLVGIAIYPIYQLSKLHLGETVDDKAVTVDTSVKKEGYLTVLLVGLDKAENGAQRSDSIIIANLNKSTGEIQLVSVYRDFFVYIQDYKKHIPKASGDFQKINASYNLKIEGLMHTINMNFSLDIHDYVSVDFSTLAEVVDALGGIDVTIPDKKNFTHYINVFGHEAAKVAKANDKWEDVPPEAQGQKTHLSGYQALGYCRVRKSLDPRKYPLPGEDDFTRAARQQEVIGIIIEKIKSQGVTKLPGLLEAFQKKDNFKTSIETKKLLELGTDAIKNNYHLAKDSSGKKFSLPQKPHEVRVGKNKKAKTGGDSTQFCEFTLVDDVKDLHAYLYPDKTLSDKELSNIYQITDKLEYFEKQYGDPGFQKFKEGGYIPETDGNGNTINYSGASTAANTNNNTANANGTGTNISTNTSTNNTKKAGNTSKTGNNKKTNKKKN